MTYEELIDQLKKELISRTGCPEDAITILREGKTSSDPDELDMIRSCNIAFENKEDNVLLLDMMLVREKPVLGITSYLRFPLHDAFDMYHEKGFEALIQQLIAYVNAKIDGRRLHARTGDDYEAVRSTLILRPLSMDLHEDDLKLRNSVYTTVGDIALVLYQVVGDGDILTTGRILESDLKRWNTAYTKEEIMREALDNTMRMYPPILFSYRTNTQMDLLHEDIQKKDITYEGSAFLSSKGTPNGAMAMFYPAVQKKILDVMGEEFLAVFLNILDVMILEVGSPALSYALDIANHQTPFGEQLSSMVFRCTRHGLIPYYVMRGKGSDATIITLISSES